VTAATSTTSRSLGIVAGVSACNGTGFVTMPPFDNGETVR
jgi:hypothetical protein